jgi:NRPS condensation-like uncharacterized protein
MTLLLRLLLLGIGVVWLFELALLTWPAYVLAWLLSIALTWALAQTLQRQTLPWAATAALLPLMGGALLALCRKRPANAMSLVDSAWFYMERPTNRMMVTGILFFSTELDITRFQQALRERLLCFDRFRQTVGRENGMLCWTEDTHFNLDHHVQVAASPTNDESALITEVNRLSATPLDFSRPLWHMQVLPQYQGGTAVIVRIHHCIADGISLIRVLLSLTNMKEPDTGSASGRRHRPSMLHQTRDFILALRKSFMRPDSDTCLKRPLSGKRVNAWSAPIPLDQVKRIAHSCNGKINDVVLAATAGALRAYLEARGEAVDSLTLRVLVPINLRPLSGPITLGNQVGFVYFSLPVHLADPIARLHAVKQEMDNIKGGQEALVAFATLNLMGALPVWLQHQVIDLFNRNASSTMTNVPGPKETLTLAGSPISNLVFFGPQSGPMGVGISVLSYANEMTLGINADANLVAEPEEVARHFQQSLLNWPLTDCD